jgi:hypothetical protein
MRVTSSYLPLLFVALFFENCAFKAQHFIRNCRQTEFKEHKMHVKLHFYEHPAALSGRFISVSTVRWFVKSILANEATQKVL